jgi:pyruvate/2-oxoglutarate dehydrogenase complex dihydrolipoamide dehydrogenase (E3) component
LRGADQVEKRMPLAKKIVFISTVYVRVEAMETFIKAGIEKTIIDTLDCILPTYLDKEFTDSLKEDLNERNVAI